MAEGFRFIPLGLVRLRTFWHSSWVTSVQHERRCSHACGADVSFRDVKIKIPDRGRWMTSCPDARRILGILKKSLSWELDTEREGSTFGARWGQTNLRATGAGRDGGGWQMKSQNRKNVCLSSYVKEPLNSKVIKSFVPELSCRYVFYVFRDSYVLCIYIMNILCTFHT